MCGDFKDSNKTVKQRQTESANEDADSICSVQSGVVLFLNR